MNCKYASSGCNYPESECIGACTHGMESVNHALGRPRWFWSAVTVALIVLLCASWVLTSVDEFAYMQAIQDDLVEVMK